MKKFLIIFAACLFVGVSAFAQTKTVTGKVIGGDDRQGIPGASVLIKETGRGVAADVDGNYSIQVAKSQTLVFSAIGYAEQSIVVGDDNVINLTLQQDISVLSEAVVVGYGVQKKENLTGAIATVNVEKTLANRQVTDVGRGLQGAVAGLTVRQFSGEVGAEPIIRVRGYSNSPNGTKDSPLLLVDNVEVPSILQINPADIESITVLKDAASAAVYGSRAAAGVILITTKQGAKTESLTVTFSSDFGWQNPTKRIEMGGVDALEYTWLDAERRGQNISGGFWRVNERSLQGARDWQEKYGKTGLVKPTDPIVYGRDWYMEAGVAMGVRTYDPYYTMVKEWTPSTHNSLSVSGLNGKTSYNLGIGYVREQGMLKPAKQDDFTRYNVSVNVLTEVNKWLTLRGGATFSDRNKRYPAVDVTQADPWYYLYRWGPLFPVGNVTDQHGIPVRGSYNETANSITANQRTMYSSVNMGAIINFTKDWDLKVDYTHFQENYSYNFAIPKFYNAADIWLGNAAGGIAPQIWTDSNGNPVFVDDEGNVVTDGGNMAYRFGVFDYNFPGGTNPEPYMTRQRRERFDNTFNAYSTYNLFLGSEEQHKFTLMLGSNVRTHSLNSMSVTKTGLYDFENPQWNFAEGTESLTTSGNEANWDSQIGFFGRLNYTFHDKYLLEFNLRRDASSVFPKHLRWNWYPSFSAGWIISKEKFMEKLEPVLSFAKFRASWGSLGDAYISNTAWVATLPYGPISWLQAGSDIKDKYYGPPKAVDNSITWQSYETLNFGLDLRFFKNKLGVTFDWFQKYTRDMVIGGDTRPATFGSAVPVGNYGEMRTSGFELTVDFSHRFNNGINIYANATLADVTGRCTKGADYKTPWENRAIGNNWVTGARYGDIWGYVTDRLYQEDDFVYNEDGTHKRIVVIIDGTPRTTNMLAGNNPNYQARFESGAFYYGPGDVKYVDLNGDGYLTPGTGTFGDPGDRMVIGNSTPRYEYGVTLGADWKGFDFKIFIQGVGKREIIGDGGLAVPGYNTTDGAMAKAIVTNFWKEDRTDAFYPRAWNLGGTAGATVTNFNYLVQTRYLLNMAYTRIKNITIGYTLPPQLLKKAHINNARFFVSLENFFTFDNLRGLPIDVEEVSGYSMFNSSNYNYGRTGQGTPTYKTVSLGLNLTF